MKNSNAHNQRFAKMTFALVYPLYLAKVERKNRTKAELDQVIEWLTGFDKSKLQNLIEKKLILKLFSKRRSLIPMRA